MTLLGTRLKRLRVELDLTQETLASHGGFVSAPGWIKLENGQRQPSEKLIEKLVTWVQLRGSFNSKGAKSLREELLLCKYLGSPSAFVRSMAAEQARETAWGKKLLAELDAPRVKPKRGRPARKLARV